MARARSPNSIEAEEMYKNGMKLVDIAKKLDVPASTVRRWKSTQNWDGKTKGKKNERSQKKKANARHKGGQPGNRNAVGNKGGPLKPGDKIAEKHGAYSSVYWDVLDESEKDMIEDIPMDEEMLLIEQIQLFAVRERRIMIAINKYRNMKGEVSLYGFNRSESKRTFKIEEDKQLYEERIEKKISAEERLPGDMYNMQTTMENKDNMIARLEKELSTVQSKKTKAIEALAKLRLEKQKIAGESKGNEVVRAWAEAVVKAREGENKDGFSPNLNCIVGGRGTGKSTIVDAINYGVCNEHDLSKCRLLEKTLTKDAKISTYFNFGSNKPYVIKASRKGKQIVTDGVVRGPGS